MTRFESVSYTDPRAVELRHIMDVEMGERYAMDALPADRLAKVTEVLTLDPATVRATVLVLEDDDTPVAHAALRMHGDDWEVKRVITLASTRGRGVGASLMNELERIARAGGARRLILQTGDRQPEAVALYVKLGYTPIPVYEPYVEAIPNSLCFEKVLD